jgi:hypothetical protein
MRDYAFHLKASFRKKRWRLTTETSADVGIGSQLIPPIYSLV